MIYLINIFVIYIYHFVIQKTTLSSNKKKCMFWIIFGLHAVLFRALANPFNYTDTRGYALAYSNIADMSFAEALTSSYVQWGHGFVALNWILSKNNPEPYFLFTILSIISVAGVVWFYYKVSNSCLIPALLYVTYPMLYLMGFGVLRQHLSVVFILLALYYIDKIKISIPLVILAISLHTSAIVFIPFYFWNKIRFEKVNIFWMSVLITGSFLILRYSMNFLLNYLPRYKEQFGTEGNNNIVPIIVIGLIIFAFMVTSSRKKIQNGVEKCIYNYMVYGFMVALFSHGLAGGGRLTIPFIYTVPPAISLLEKYIRNKMIYYFFVALIFMLIITLIYISYTPDQYDYIPFWETVRV